MPRTYRTAVVLMAFCAASSAIIPALLPRSMAFAQIARGTLTIQNTASITYDSFFIGSATNDPDWYWSDQPLLAFSRKAGLATLSADGGITITRYNDNTHYNSEDLTASIGFDLPTQVGARFDADFSAAYTESTEVDYSLNDRIPTRSIVGNIAMNYRLGYKTSLTESAGYTKLMRNTSNYSDQQVWHNNLGFRYVDFLYGTDLSVNYVYTKTDSDGNVITGIPLDQTDHSFSATATHPIYGEIEGSVTVGYDIFERSSAESTLVGGDRNSSSFFFALGVDGPFLPRNLFPKLTSHASLYYRNSTSAGLGYGGGSTLTGDVSLDWAARPRTQMSISANRSVNLNAADYSVTNTNVNYSITESVGDSLTLVAGVGYRWSEYHGLSRDDGFFTANASANYNINEYWHTTLSYNCQDNQNESAGFQPLPYEGRTYSRQVVTLSLVCKF